MTEHNVAPSHAEKRAPLMPPGAEELLQALDHLDAAYELAVPLDAKVCEHIHLAREQAQRTAGFMIFQYQRRLRDARNDGDQ